MLQFPGQLEGGQGGVRTGQRDPGWTGQGSVRVDPQQGMAEAVCVHLITTMRVIIMMVMMMVVVMMMMMMVMIVKVFKKMTASVLIIIIAVFLL